MDQKRVFLAIVLSFLVLTVFQLYFMPTPPAPQPRQASAQAPTGPTSTTTPDTVTPQPVTPPAPTAPRVAALVADDAAHEIVVDTDAVHAVFSTQGAVLTSWRLKRYLDKGEPKELVPSDIPRGYARPFALSTDDAALSATLASALYRPSSTTPLSLGAGMGTLSFDYQDVSGLTAHKAFQFQPDGKPYLLIVNASVAVGGVEKPVVLSWGPALGLGYSTEGSRYAYPPAVVQFRNGAIERPSIKDLTASGQYEGAMDFAGVGDQFFLTAVVAGPTPVRVAYTPIELPVPGDTAGLKRTFIAYSVRTPAASTLPFFIGPKDTDILKSVNVQLIRAVNFGMFALLVVPLLQSLRWLNGFIGNWGFSIVALTVLLNLAIFPLRHRSMVSMRKMQALQPQIKVIQDRYAKYKMADPERQKMNTEMMALYKEKGVNPASGCVPMLLTMPILFAFYAMLAAAIELRGAPFVGWIHDLSIHDPLYITPVLMGATMFWQQWLMPSTADPMQKKMFMIMPLAFTFGFLWAPSGLVLYWLMSNMMAIGQQYVTNRLIGAPPGAKFTKSGKQLPMPKS
jgi:YidC/Oxa1 family membrane protein insertase